MLILFTKRHFVTRVKFIALYKQLDKTQIYIHLNKQNLQYSTTETKNSGRNSCKHINSKTIMKINMIMTK